MPEKPMRVALFCASLALLAQPAHAQHAHGEGRLDLAIDKDRLDLSERQAVEHWMKRWGVTRDQLTAAHRKAGRMVKDIAAELGKKR